MAKAGCTVFRLEAKSKIIAVLTCFFVFCGCSVFAEEKEKEEIKATSESSPVVANIILDAALFGIAGGPLFAWQMLAYSVENEMRERVKIYTPEHAYQEHDKLIFTFNNGQQILTIRQNKTELYGYLRFIDREFEGRLYVPSFSIDFVMEQMKESGTINVRYSNVPSPNNNIAIVTSKGYVIIEDLQDERIYGVRLPYAEELAKKLGIY